MPPALYSTNPSCPKGCIFSSLWPRWPLGTQLAPGVQGFGVPVARVPLPCWRSAWHPGCLHRGMGPQLRVSLPGSSSCCAYSKPFPCTQSNHGMGTERYMGTQVMPPEPLQHSFCSPYLGPAPQGGLGMLGIVPFPLIRRQSRCLSGLFFIRERLLLGHPGPQHWSGRGFAANPRGCAGGSHAHTCTRTHMHTRTHAHTPPAASVLSGCQMYLFISTSHLFTPSGQAGY